ncbi:hypothetical protein [Deinococcus multiflagellatus]|uniref:Uncharacterized protein n=1 Tax=Deinococcus multiflagellatus TaxID=1656887 RepID=A0ABW1ZRS3_9DEIO
MAVEKALAALDLPGRDERARRKTLSRVVGVLGEALGWPDAVRYDQGVLVLSPDLRWHLHRPAPAQAELFCEGRYDPWITEWRDEHGPLRWVDWD